MNQKAFAGLAAGVALSTIAILIPSNALAQAPAATPPAPIMPPSLPASHVVDLMTPEGSAAFGARWKVSDVRLVEVPAIPNTETHFKTTYNIEPRAGAANFDDSKWQTIEATDLGGRRSGGHVAFMWYRAEFTIPAKIGAFDTANAVIVCSWEPAPDSWVKNGSQDRLYQVASGGAMAHRSSGSARAHAGTRLFAGREPVLPYRRYASRV
jgi:hypothetical protein